MAEEIETQESLVGGRANAATTQPAPALDPSAGVLDRRIAIDVGDRWFLIWTVGIVVAALALRLPRLDAWALDAAESAHAYDAWILFRGQPSFAGSPTPDVGAFLLLLESFAFFLFGATDVVARLVPTVAGIALVAIPFTFRRWLGWPASLGMAALVAISPTMVYASRVISPEVVIGALALAALAILVHAGEETNVSSNRAAAILLGVIAGAAYAAGPSTITVGLTLSIAIAAAAYAFPTGIVRRGLRMLRGEFLAFLLAAVVTAVLLFTRFLSAPLGIVGAAETLRGWWRILVDYGGQPPSLFLMILFVYEPIAVIFAIVAVVRRRTAIPEAIVLFATWWLAAFTIWSFAAGHQPEHAIHVALPLVLLAGVGLGATLAAIDWSYVRRGGGVLALMMLGMIVGLAAVGVLLIGVAGRGLEAALAPVAVLCLVVMPLAYLIWRLSLDGRAGGHAGQPLLLGLLVLALLFTAFGLRSATLLSLYRADLGIEPLAQQTASLGTLPAVEGFLHLARDVGVDQGSARDPTGSHGLKIALEQDVRWPFLWYFREFPDLTVVAPGPAAGAGAQVVIAAGDAGLTEAGYATQRWPWLNTVPAQYLSPDVGAALRAVVSPSHWVDVWRFLLFRDGVPAPDPAMVSVGLTAELAGHVMPATGPFGLNDRPGPGTESGQFKDPIGVAVAQDGAIEVVDSGNARVQRFTGGGDFLGIWGEGNGDVTFTRTANGLGPTGITVGPDGRTWVADTWGHRVVALDANGNIVQSIGGETIDIADDPARVDEGGGRFFGPRAIAITSDAIYVVDTGNERIQRFTPEGAFVDAWGGYGRGPGQLVEPVGIAVGPDGNLYVADSGNARISIFTPSGEPVAQWPVPDWPAPDPTGSPPAYQPYLAFDSQGNLYATASNAGEVIVFNRQGSVIARVTQAGTDHLAQPVGVTIAADGKVLFSDIGLDAVVTYAPAEQLGVADLGSKPSAATATP